MQVRCEQCQKPFNKEPSQIKRTKHNFCSSSCSAIFSNTRKPKKKRFCEFCHKPLTRKSKYCSSICFGKATTQRKIHEWLKGIIKGHDPSTGHIKPFVRKFILERDKFKCVKCNFDKLHPVDGLPVLQVNHIDGNVSNTIQENLESLCPTCHAMTPNFGVRNRGYGRDSIGFTRNKSIKI